uniref:Uncharacterized protein n=1 Tax=Ditylum brightwellii TaxID=49249 RepID=A0A7S4SQD1_9STRA|mmetsp:Transcript_10060/g.13450  ORF Transcript_10060/g.13450 Transcript_10060/m.13450 type:complete len:178 (+) Transcript_10060:249-782(+)
MPAMDPIAALQLCQMEETIKDKEETISEEEEEEQDTSSPSSSSRTPLQRRCASEISKQWKDLTIDDDETDDAIVHALLLGQRTDFLVDVFVQCLQNSRAFLKASEDWNNILQKELDTAKEKYEEQLKVKNHASHYNRCWVLLHQSFRRIFAKPPHLQQLLPPTVTNNNDTEEEGEFL